jgi:hypothetical protein
MAIEVLFNNSSISQYSQTTFTIDKQVTVSAIGIPAGVTITFEMLHLEAPAYEAMCDAACPELPPSKNPTVTAWQQLMCCAEMPVRINAATPSIVLDTPQKVRLRAVMTGFDFSATPFSGVVTVVDSDSQITNDAMRGCCPDPVVVVPPPPAPTVYCPSFYYSACDGCNQVGYAFRDNGLRDPAATVQISDCDGGVVAFIYPTAGITGAVRHEVPYFDETGAVVGYLANQSDCAPPLEQNVNVTVQAPVVPNVPRLVATNVADDGTITNTMSDGSTVVSNGFITLCP